MAALQKKEATLAPVVSKVGKDEFLDSIQPIANFEGIPPTIAVTGALCYYCFRPEGGKIFGTKHMICNRCKAVKYCNATCQKRDWPRHKGVCKVLHKFETSKLLKQLLVLQLMDAPFDEQEQLDAAVARLVDMQLDIGGQLLKRPLNTAERNLIALGPRCTTCGKSPTILRIEAEMNKEPVKLLKECEYCGLAWACCTEHWDLILMKHRAHVASGGRDGLPECLINRDIQSDVNVNMRLTSDNGGRPHVWFHGLLAKVYKPLKGSDWAEELDKDINQHPFVKDTICRITTLGLSMPNTILWAFENLNEGTGWSLKQNVTIHVLGAYQYEWAHAGVFEELLHRLPRLKKLKIFFIGPQMDDLIGWKSEGKETAEEVCDGCKRAQKKMFFASWGKTYHEAAASNARRLSDPDMVAAFNAALDHDKDRENLWGPTIKYLVDNNRPCVFTSYCQEDAQADIDVLQEAGAKIPEGLGPILNPWQCKMYRKEPRKSGGYMSPNKYITGVFK